MENELSIGNVKIQMRTHTKFLEVLVDQHLTFEEHCKFIKEKISRGIGILYKGKNISESEIVIEYVLCFHRPILYILHYCVGQYTSTHTRSTYETTEESFKPCWWGGQVCS